MNKVSLIVSLVLVSSVGFSVEKKAAPHPTATRLTHTETFSSSDYENEIMTSFSGGAYTNMKVGTATVSTLAAQGSWAKFIQRKIQVGGEAGFTSVSGGATSTSYFDLMGFGTYNLDDDTKNSIYAKAGAGFFGVPNTSGGYDNKFGFMIGGGKRFALWDRISYAPEARLIKKGDLDMMLNIYFLNLSIAF